MATTDNTSKSLHYIQVLERQPGIDESMTLKQIKEILSNEEKAAKIDSQLESPFYNQAKLSFQRLSKQGNTVLITCKPAAIKLYLILANYINQSNVVCVSRLDLAKISEMSRPTINTASEELVHKGLMMIERGNEGQGEAIIYILNPECLASGKLIYHKNLVYHYWEKAGTAAKERFEIILKQQEAKVSAEFQVEDATLRGEVEPRAKIIRKGKEINQRKKMADAASIDHQGTANPQSQLHDIREHQKNQEKSVAAFNMQNGMTAEENELFSPEGDEQPGNSAYSIHNNTKEEE